MRVLVTDSHYKMSLAPVRSLHEAGYHVACGDYDDIPDKLNLGAGSKCCQQVMRWARAERAAEEIAALCDKGDVILPVGRDTLRSFAARPELKQRVHFLTSDLETLDLADDKAAIAKLAKELDILVPETHDLTPQTDLAALADTLRYPAIVKYHNGEQMGLHSHERYTIVRDQAQFLQAYETMGKRSTALLVQDYLVGNDVGVAVVMDDHAQPVDFLCYVSKLEYPISGGPTCLCETFFDRKLLQDACKLLQAIGFKGIAMLDFKRSGDRSYLLEINPRVWGSASLAHICHASFFESYVRAAMGTATVLDVASCEPSYAIGAKMKFFPQCLVAAMKEFTGGHRRAAWSHGCSALSVSVRDGLFQCRDSKPYTRYLFNVKRST